MAARAQRKLAHQTLGLSMAAPLVIAHQMARPGSLLPTSNTLARHALQVMSQGMAPVYRRAAGNAKRLGRLEK